MHFYEAQAEEAEAKKNPTKHIVNMIFMIWHYNTLFYRQEKECRFIFQEMYHPFHKPYSQNIR